MKEIYPSFYEERTDLFLRLKEINSLLNSSSKIAQIRSKYDILCSSLKKYDEYKESFEKLAAFLKEFEETKKDKKNISDFEIAYMAFRHDLQLSDIDSLNRQYRKYLELCDEVAKTKAILDLKNIGSEEDLKKERKDIRDRLITSNVELVKYCIIKFFGDAELPFEDTMMVGIQGLISAVDTFECRKDGRSGRYISFFPYAVKTIKNEIIKEFKALKGISWEDYNKKIELEELKKRLSKEYNVPENAVSKWDFMFSDTGDIDYKEIPELEGLPYREIPFSELHSREEIDMEDSIPNYLRSSYTDIDGLYRAQDEYLDATEIEDPRNPMKAIDANVEITGLYKNLKEAMKVLSPIEQQVVRYRTCLDGEEFKSFEKIGKEFGITRNRVKQIYTKALMKLCHPPRFRTLVDFLESDFEQESNNERIIK